MPPSVPPTSNSTPVAHREIRHRRVPLKRRHWVLILHWVLMFAATHWPQINRYKPRTGWPIPFFSEIVHLVLYAVWGGLWWWVLSRSPKGASTRALSNVLLGGFFYACFDEATQLIVGRGGKSYDVLVDTVGIAAALSLLEGWRRYRDSR